MKKTVMVLLMICTLALISCTQLMEEQEPPINIPETLNRAEEALEDGNDALAQELFQQVLNAQPNNPKANAAMGCIHFLKGNQKIISLTESVSSQLSASARRISPLSLLMDLNFAAGQNDLVLIIQDLEAAKASLEKAMGLMNEHTTLNLYPNRFDWNQDGFVDPTTPLNVSFDLYGTGETRLWWVLFYNPAPISSPRAVFDDTKRGDAWFDIETVNALIYDDVMPIGYEPVFDEDDYLALTIDEVEVLLCFVNMELALLEPGLIYNINPKPELSDFLLEASNTIHLYEGTLDYATQTLDTDQNGTMTNAEIRTIFPQSFLRFYDHPQGGLNAIADWKDAINDFAQIGIELESEGFFDFTDADMLRFFEFLDAFVNDADFKIDVTPPPLSMPRLRIPSALYFKPSAFFNNPSLFEDLKDLLIPNINYVSFIITFPDPTFGGLLVEEYPPLPTLLRSLFE